MRIDEKKAVQFLAEELDIQPRHINFIPKEKYQTQLVHIAPPPFRVSFYANNGLPRLTLDERSLPFQMSTELSQNVLIALESLTRLLGGEQSRIILPAGTDLFFWELNKYPVHFAGDENIVLIKDLWG